MKNLTYLQTRQKYLDFMKEKGHVEIPDAPLVPENDPSLLFVAAGMVPLVPFLMGEKHPAGTRLTNVQRCVRTGDIDETGNDTHCSAFLMLGNWSLNDYFKKEAVNMSVEFLTEELGLDIYRIYASVFEGDRNAARDEESISIWQDIFQKSKIQAKAGRGERLQLYGKKKNWWELEAGGPCGPCTEIFYDTGKAPCGPDCHVNCDCGKYVELGNNVFMEYLKKEGTYSPLGKHNVDFGGGLERQVMLMQGKDNYYETDIYLPILNKVKSMSIGNSLKSQRIVADHIKAATWIIMDGVKPSRTEQGYVLRRLIRRAVRYGRLLQIQEPFTRTIGEIAITQFSPIYPALKEKELEILGIMEDEELKFQRTIKSGLKQFETMLEEKKMISGDDAFYLYETYGFPIEITKEMATEKGLTLNTNEFQEAFNKHKEKSRSASRGFFKGGLGDTSEMSKRYHTATHLLNEALRRVMGKHIVQKGSNINPQRLRFDFPGERKLTSEEIKKVENLVNEQIEKGLEVYFEEMTKKDALTLAPHSVFADKYGATVKVYFVGRGKDNFATEICGGPHVANTRELGKFKIVKQENIGSGIRRLKAVLT